MKLEQLQATISHYPTQPGSLVLLRCPPGTPEDALEHVGRALHEWGVNNGLFIFGVIGELDIEVLGPEDLAKLGLQRIQRGLTVDELPSIPPGDNPFWHDFIKMGSHIRDWTDSAGRTNHIYALFNSVDPNYPATQRYARVLDLYDTSTGRVWRIELPVEPQL